MRRHTWSYGSCSRGTRPSLEMLLPQHKILQDLIVLAQMISKSSEAPRRNEMPPWKALRTPKWKHLKETKFGNSFHTPFEEKLLIPLNDPVDGELCAIFSRDARNTCTKYA